MDSPDQVARPVSLRILAVLLVFWGSGSDSLCSISSVALMLSLLRYHRTGI